MSNGDQLLHSYSIISSLKINIPDGYEINDTWVREYHSALEKMEKELALDLTDFKVPSEEVKRSVASSNYISGKVSYRDGLWCKRAILMHKVDSVLAYFSGLQSGEERKIGFRPPGRDA